MSQNSIQVPTSGPLQGLTLVQDVNAALDSLARLFSGPAAPTTSALGLTGLAGVLWHDTTANLLKIRDQADSTWISLGALDESGKTFAPSGAQAANARLSDLAGISWAQGDIAYFNGSNLVKLAVGTSGYFLKTLGSGANPAWASAVPALTALGTGTPSASNFLRGDGVWASAGILTKSYDSGNQTITNGGALTLAHGLGVIPKVIVLALKCITGELGYMAGMEAGIGEGPNDASGNNRGVAIGSDASNVSVRFGTGGQILIHLTNGTNSAVITNSNWALIVRAYA